MKIGIFGSRDWDNYLEVMRILTIAIQDATDKEDTELVIVHAPMRGADDMVTEYIGKTERFLKQKNFKIKEVSVRKDSPALTDMAIMESGISSAIIFSTGCRRTRTCAKILDEYEIPYSIINP